MRIKINDTWKSRVDVELPGEGVDDYVTGHYVAEFKELSLSQMKQVEKSRRAKVRELSRLRKDDEADPAEIERLEDALNNADRELLDRVLVNAHGLELEKADGAVMSSAELLDYVKDHIDFMVPTVQAFAGRIQRIAEKNSKRSGRN